MNWWGKPILQYGRLMGAFLLQLSKAVLLTLRPSNIRRKGMAWKLRVASNAARTTVNFLAASFGRSEGI